MTMSTDPFNFDISVSADKQRRKRAKGTGPGAQETSLQSCQHRGCEKPGKYRAPMNPNNMEEFRWFCLAHVRQFNQKWNYYEHYDTGTFDNPFASSEDGQEKPRGKTTEQRAWERMGINNPHQVLGKNATQNPGRGNALGGSRRLTIAEKRAIVILEAKEYWNKEALRKQYKALIKTLHPDLNGGDRSHESQLQDVVWAWDQIKDSRTFD